MQENLLPEELEIVKPVVNRNAFMAHPDNILLAALVDRKSSVREQALRKVLQARKNSFENPPKVFGEFNRRPPKCNTVLQCMYFTKYTTKSHMIFGKKNF